MFNKKFLSSTLVALAFSLGANAGGDYAQQNQCGPAEQGAEQKECDSAQEGQWRQDDATVALPGHDPVPVTTVEVSAPRTQWNASQDGAWQQQFEEINLQEQQSSQRGFECGAINQQGQDFEVLSEGANLTKRFKTQGLNNVHAVKATIGGHLKRKTCGQEGFSNSKFENSKMAHASFDKPVTNIIWLDGDMNNPTFHAHVSHSRLSGKIRGAEFLGGMSHVNFSSASFFKHGHIHNVTTKKTIFAGRIDHIDFAGVNLDYADFSQVIFGQHVSFQGATIGRHVNFAGAQVEVIIEGEKRLLPMTEEIAARFVAGCHGAADVASFFAMQGFTFVKNGAEFAFGLVGGMVDAAHTLGHNTFGAFKVFAGGLVDQAHTIHARFDSDSDSESSSDAESNVVVATDCHQ